MAAFKFNLQQLDLLGAYDRYTKELEDQKKQELYDNKLVEQEVDDFVKYYNPKSLRESDSPLLYNEFKNYETSAKALNKARKIGNVNDINKYRKNMQEATANMGDIHSKSTIAKKVAADLAVLKDQERKGLITIDDNEYKNKFTLFTTGNLNDIEKTFGKPDTWGNIMTGVEYDNNKLMDDVYKAKTAFNKNPVGFKITPTGKYEEEKLDGKVVKLYPLVEKAPVYAEALKYASLQPEPVKNKLFQEFKRSIAQGGAYADAAIMKQQKIAAEFKVAPENVTADMLLAFTIAPEPVTQREGKGIDKWKMDLDEAKFKYKQDLDKKKIEIAKAKAANKGKSDKMTGIELGLFTNYYKESKDKFSNSKGLTNVAAFQEFLDGEPKMRDFMNKLAPKTKTDPNEAFKVLEGYMKNPQSLYATMGGN